MRQSKAAKPVAINKALPYEGLTRLLDRMRNEL